MRGQLEVLKNQIRKLEAGGARNTQLRREYNSKLRSHRYDTHKSKLHSGGAERAALPLVGGAPGDPGKRPPDEDSAPKLDAEPDADPVPLERNIADIVQDMVGEDLFDFTYYDGKKTKEYTKIVDVFRRKFGITSLQGFFDRYESARNFPSIKQKAMTQLLPDYTENFDLGRNQLLFLMYKNGKIILQKVNVTNDGKGPLARRFESLRPEYKGDPSTVRLHDQIKAKALKGGGGELSVFATVCLFLLLGSILSSFASAKR